jgi:hypothetical protein
MQPDGKAWTHLQPGPQKKALSFLGELFWRLTPCIPASNSARHPCKHLGSRPPLYENTQAEFPANSFLHGKVGKWCGRKQARPRVTRV